MAIGYLPDLFAGGNAGRARGGAGFQNALSRRQNSRQFRRRLRHEDEQQERQIQAQKDAQKRAFGYQLAGQGINAAAGAGAGLILSEATGPAVSTLADGASKGITADVASAAGGDGLVPLGSPGPDLLATSGGPGTANLPQIDYSPMSTNIPAASANPGFTGLEPLSTAKTSAPLSPLPDTGGPVLDPTADARIPEWSRSAPLKSGRLSPGAAAALGALSGFTGNDYLGTGLQYANRNPVTNAKFGLELAQTGSGIGLDAARAAQAYSGTGANDALANDRNASAARTQFLTPLEGRTELTAGDENLAQARYNDAGTRQRNVDTATAVQMRPLDARVKTNQADYYEAGTEGRRQSNMQDNRMFGPQLRKATADANYAEGRAGRPQGGLLPAESAFELQNSLESRLGALQGNAEAVNAEVDQFISLYRNRLTPEDLDEILVRARKFGYAPRQRGSGTSEYERILGGR